MKWLAPVLDDRLRAGEPVAIVTVAEARGSTPREAGARMLVSREQSWGTIGGGRLEYDAIREARALLAAGEHHALREVPLGPALGQCCGGHATVLIERAGATDPGWLAAREAGGGYVLLTRLDAPAPKLLLDFKESPPEGVPQDLMQAAEQALIRRTPARVVRADGTAWLVEPIIDDLPRVLVFGAGHIGRALVAALAPLPCRVRWIDQRAELFAAPPPDGVDVALTEHPRDEVRAAPAGVFALVMTHSHDLDCDLCEAFLKRADFAFLGLIGSATKRARFEKRWRAKGIADETSRRLVCPIGLAEIRGKQPEVIAASTAAQLLVAFERQPALSPPAERPLVDA
jgi:xanthine dehydrogenase accessory factor